MQSTRIALCAVLALTGACTTDNADPVNTVEQYTMGSGASATVLANAYLGDGEVEVKWNGDKAKVKSNIRVIMQQIVLQPGGHTGWHTHPGLAFASITDGTLTVYDADAPCEGTDYPAGTAFVDHGGGHVHLAKNNTSAPATVKVQYVIEDGLAVRGDVPAPLGACF